MCHPQPGKPPMHLREERHRGRVLRTSTNYLEKPVVQPRGLGTRWKSPLEPYPLSGPGKHSRDSGSDSGIATAVAAAQPNLLPQKAPAHPPMQRSTSGHREEHQGYCWYAPCRGPSTFHWQLHWFWSARGVMVPRGLVPWRVCHHCNPQPPVPPPEVVLICLQPERELDRGRGNRAPPPCRGSGAWLQLQDDHLPTMRRCLIHERHLSMLTAQAREAVIVNITRHQVTTASRNARVTRCL